MAFARRLGNGRKGYLISAARPTTLACLLAALAALAWPAAGDGPSAQAPSKDTEESSETIDPLSVNATCYVCHIPFVREEISSLHFAEQITCIKCHGLSAAHANDEDIGATKPDIVYRRDQVDKKCMECHEGHDVPARDVIARFVTRKLADTAAVCTDCHGHHRIEEPVEDLDEE